MDPFYPCILLDELHPIRSTAEENLPHDLLSKADFLHAVETLAGNLTSEFTAGDMETFFATCPYDTWKQTFGEPRGIQEHRVACQSAVQAWEQPCSDGLVHCVGHFVDDPHRGQCVVLTRVCLF